MSLRKHVSQESMVSESAPSLVSDEGSMLDTDFADDTASLHQQHMLPSQSREASPAPTSFGGHSHDAPQSSPRDGSGIASHSMRSDGRTATEAGNHAPDEAARTGTYMSPALNWPNEDRDDRHADSFGRPSSSALLAHVGDWVVASGSSVDKDTADGDLELPDGTDPLLGIGAQFDDILPNAAFIPPRVM